jgi:hypothetical protein
MTVYYYLDSNQNVLETELWTGSDPDQFIMPDGTLVDHYNGFNKHFVSFDLSNFELNH